VLALVEELDHLMADFLNRPDGYQTRCADEMRPPTFIG